MSAPRPSSDAHPADSPEASSLHNSSSDEYAHPSTIFGAYETPQLHGIPHDDTTSHDPVISQFLAYSSMQPTGGVAGEDAGGADSSSHAGSIKVDKSSIYVQEELAVEEEEESYANVEGGGLPCTSTTRGAAFGVVGETHSFDSIDTAGRPFPYDMLASEFKQLSMLDPTAYPTKRKNSTTTPATDATQRLARADPTLKRHHDHHDSLVLQGETTRTHPPHGVEQRVWGPTWNDGAPVDNGTGYPMNWNAEFQKILELPEDTEHELLDKHERLSALAADFQHTAKNCGKIIISEVNIPPAHRTIKPVAVGGHAGGEKFIYHGILFKFAMDWLKIYKSDEYAMKAAGHELKGLMRYYACEGISVPLMALVDYRGFRLVASSILPIDSSTLRYGSDDGGVTMRASDQKLNELMQQAAMRINIKGHIAGLHKDDFAGKEMRLKLKLKLTPREFLYAPADVEGHKGSDGRYYVLDTARVFPPTAERDVLKTYLYKMFRPEFVKVYGKPLSSDAFSRFGGPENLSQGHNKEVVEATQYLKETVIVKFAQWLEEKYRLNKDATDLTDMISFETQLTELIHREGINCRYLGLIRRRLRTPQLQTLLLNEMVARVVKNRLRYLLRVKVKKARNPLANVVYRRVVLDFFNEVLGRGKHNRFWKEEVKTALLRSFNDSLFPEEMDPSFCLRDLLDPHALFQRVQQLTGVKLSEHSRRELQRNPTSFHIVVPDIVKVSAKVKHMNIVSLAEGNALYMRSSRNIETKALKLSQASGVVSEQNSERLFRLAMTKFEDAIRSFPDNRETLVKYADALQRTALQVRDARTYPFLAKAYGKYKMARAWSRLFTLGEVCYEEATSGEVWQHLGPMLQLSSRCFQALCEHFDHGEFPMEGEGSLRIDAEPHRISGVHGGGIEKGSEIVHRAYYCWARVLLTKAYVGRDDEAYKLAGQRFLRALHFNSKPFPVFHRWDACNVDGLKTMASHTLGTSSAMLGPMDMAVLFDIRQSSTQMESVDASKCYRKDALSASLLKKLIDRVNAIRIGGLDVGGSVESVGNDTEDSKGMRLHGDGTREEKVIHTLKLDGCTQFKSAFALSRLTTDHGMAFSTLSLANCGIDDNGIIELANNCSALTSLNVSATAITDVGLRSVLSGCLQLRHLNISKCMSIAFENYLPGDPRRRDLSLALEHLNVSCCSAVSRHLLPMLMRCASLKQLDASHVEGIPMDALHALSRSPNLQVLRLRCCQAHGTNAPTQSGTKQRRGTPQSDPKKVTFVHSKGRALARPVPPTALSSVDHPRLLFTGLKNAVLFSLGKNAKALSEIDVSYNTRLTDKGVIGLASGCLNLTRVSMCGLESLSDEGVNALAMHCPSLAHVDFSYCPNITRGGLSTLLRHCGAHLCSLALAGCERAIDASLFLQSEEESSMLRPTHANDEAKGAAEDVVGDHTRTSRAMSVMALPRLERLTLNATGLEDDAVAAISQACPSLHSLDLSDNVDLLDDAMQSLSSGCPQLRELKLNRCRGVTDVGIGQLADGCHFLKRLELSGCLCVHKIGVLAVACPFLEQIILQDSRNVDNGALLALAALPSMRTMNMFGCQFARDEVLLRIVECGFVETLVMGGNKITDGVFNEVKKKARGIDIYVDRRDSVGSYAVD